MFPNVLEGSGFRLRMITPADAEALTAYQALPEVYLTTSSDPGTLTGAREWGVSNVEGAADGRWCRWGIVVDGDERLVGSIGLVVTHAAHRRAELGYDLAPAQWGRGVMTRAASVVLDWAFDEGGFHRIEATVMSGNLRSEAVLTRLGFQREGLLRDYKLARGTYRDFSMWSLLSSDARPGA